MNLTPSTSQFAGSVSTMEDRQPLYSSYKERKISRRLIHDIVLPDFQTRLANGERLDANPESEVIHFRLGARPVSVQVAVRRKGGGDDEDLVSVSVVNRTTDGLKVVLSATLRGLDPDGRRVELSRREDVPLEREAERGVCVFSFRRSDASRFCYRGSLCLRLEMVAFTYAVATEGGGENQGEEVVRGSEAQPTPSRSPTLLALWGNLDQDDEVSRPISSE